MTNSSVTSISRVSFAGTKLVGCARTPGNTLFLVLQDAELYARTMPDSQSQIITPSPIAKPDSSEGACKDSLAPDLVV